MGFDCAGLLFPRLNSSRLSMLPMPSYFFELLRSFLLPIVLEKIPSALGIVVLRKLFPQGFILYKTLSLKPRPSTSIIAIKRSPIAVHATMIRLEGYLKMPKI